MKSCITGTHKVYKNIAKYPNLYLQSVHEGIKVWSEAGHFVMMTRPHQDTKS
jgi:hypothetical protein